MPSRYDYYDDPESPPANSIKPSASAFVVHEGRLLLTRRSDNGNWSIPGGAQDPGESLSRTAQRETLEETGILVRPEGLVGVFTDPRHVVHYTSNDEVRQEFTVVYRARYLEGQATVSEETTEVEWVELDRVDALPMERSQRLRIQWGLSNDQPYIDPVGD